MPKDNKNPNGQKKQQSLPNQNNANLSEENRQRMANVYNHQPVKYNFLGINSIINFFRKIRSFFKNFFVNLSFSKNRDAFIEDNMPKNGDVLPDDIKNTKAFYRELLRDERAKMVAEQVKAQSTNNKEIAVKDTVLDKFLQFEKTVEDRHAAEMQFPVTEFIKEQMFNGKVMITDICTVLSFVSESRVSYNEETQKFAFVFNVDDGYGIAEIDFNGKITFPEVFNEQKNAFSMIDGEEPQLVSALRYAVDRIDFNDLFYAVNDNALPTSNISMISDFLDKNKDNISEDMYNKCQNVVNGINANYLNSKFILSINRAFDDVVNNPFLTATEKLQYGLIDANNIIKNLDNPLQYHATHMLSQKAMRAFSDPSDAFNVSSKLFNVIDKADLNDNFVGNSIYSQTITNIATFIDEYNLSIDDAVKIVSTYVNANDITSFNINNAIVSNDFKIKLNTIKSEVQNSNEELSQEELSRRALSLMDLTQKPQSISVDMMLNTIKATTIQFEELLKNDSANSFVFSPEFLVYTTVLPAEQFSDIDFTPTQKDTLVLLVEKINKDKAILINNQFESEMISFNSTTNATPINSTPETDIVDITPKYVDDAR
jgi:hypothetical protein